MTAEHAVTDRLAVQWPATAGRRAAVAGFAFGVTGTLVALLVVAGFGAVLGSNDVRFQFGLPLAACLGSAVVAAPLWLFLVERPDEPSTVRGGVIGATVGVGAHPLTWLIFGVGSRGLVLASAGPRALNAAGWMLDVVGSALLASVVGFVVTGIVTVPAGIVVGAVLADVRARTPRGEKATDAEDVERPSHL